MNYISPRVGKQDVCLKIKAFFEHIVETGCSGYCLGLGGLITRLQMTLKIYIGYL